MVRERYLRTLRALVECYQAFERYSARHLRELGLTPPQFDIVATLGNTSGMTFRELGEKTLITKGTLTGVIDRLEKKNLVQREVPPGDRRSVIVKLTPEGEALFEKIFPVHIADLRDRCSQMEPSELDLLRILLGRLRRVF